MKADVKMHTSSWEKTLFGFIFMAVLIVLGCMGSTSDAMAKTGLQITKADWNPRKSVLIVQGRGNSGYEVQVFNAGTMEKLSSEIDIEKGRWSLVLKNLSGVPCQVLVQVDESEAVKDVRKAPGDCINEESPTPTQPTLVGIIIEGPNTVNEETSADYTARATFSDGSQQIAGSAVWTLDDSAYATIDGSNGVLTAKEVPQNQTVTITAGYTQDETSQTANKTVMIADAGGGGGGVLEGSHAERITIYEGTKTCLACHKNEALEVHASVHYQWKGDASEVIELDGGKAGKLGGLNDFCIYPDINWIGKLTNVDGAEKDGGCAKCHVGLGQKPTAEATDSQLENIDCLVCHSASYKRTVEMVGGAYRFVPDTANMAVSVDQAAADITQPSRDRCLNCHANAGGGNNFKRGDLEVAHMTSMNPTRQFDVHMAASANGGAGLNCLDCHTASAHKIAGRGTDLSARELSDPVNCAQCHSSQPHESSNINKHMARVNCTVCHIPTFAKIAPTDMDRDWSKPGVLVDAKGLYEPDHIKETRVIPEYRFFNGLSHFYIFGETAVPGDSGSIVMSEPDGNVNDGAKIYAFKHHSGYQPIESGGKKRLLPLKIGNFFETGQIQAAVQMGAEAVGWTYNGHTFAETERYMGLFHEVAPKEDALSCNSCHNGGNRLDFAALGYTPNESYNNKPLCASCHSDESGEWSASELFTEVHQEHVSGENIDCNRCHSFSSAN